MNANSSSNAPTDLAGNLRQMIAVLETERQALATLQPDALIAVTREKEGLCNILDQAGTRPLDEKTRALAETAKSLNDANRRVRNLLAANVAGRLNSLGADRPGRHAYSAQATG